MAFCNFGCCFPCCCCGCCCRQPVQQQEQKVIKQIKLEPAAPIAMFVNEEEAMILNESVPFTMQMNKAAPMVKHYAGSEDVYLKKGKYAVSYNATITSTEVQETTAGLQLSLDSVLMPETLQRATVELNHFTNIASFAYVDVTKDDTILNVKNMCPDPVTLSNTKLSIVPLGKY